MNYNQTRYQKNDNNNKRKQMEDEMNRFENEISNGSLNYQPQSNQKLGMPSMFIPHQLQRQHNMIPNQMQMQRPAMIPNLAPLNLPSTHSQPPFLPSTNAPPNLLRPPIPPNIHSNIINQTQSSSGFTPIIQHPFMQPNMNIHNTNPSNTSAPASVKTSYTVTPMALPANVHNVSNPVQPANTNNKKQKTSDSSKTNNQKKQKKVIRTAGGITWEDPTLQEWSGNDFRIFCGDLGNDVNEDILTRAFNKYPSFLKCKVVRDKRTNKSKGYGFISFKEPGDFTKAMRDMDGKYVGSRPIKLRRSNWKDRNIEVVKKKMKEKQKLGLI